MLAWLTILAPENKDVVTQHWKRMGEIIIAVGTLREWIGEYASDYDTIKGKEMNRDQIIGVDGVMGVD